MKIKLHWQILIGLMLGIIYGLFFPEQSGYVEWLGDIFLRALKMIIVPLILTSIISGVSNIGNAKSLGKLGIKTISYYLVTSVFAIISGLILVNIIQPGVGTDLGLQKNVNELEALSGGLGNILLRIVPTNIFEALVSADMLAIIFFSILTGFYITKLNKDSSTLLINIFNSSFEVMMKITSLVIKFAPIGILGIVTSVIAEQAADKEALIKMIQGMALYMIAVLSGLVIHAFITLPLFLRLIGKSNTWEHFKAMSTPLLTAFSTSSSSATLPLTLNAVEKNAGVSNKITSFVLPLGATVNMDGTALYECVAAIFIAQAYGIELSFVQQMIVVVTALLASIGAAGIPMAGLVMISVVLSSVGLPLEGVGLILAVDRILDMCRTTVNVWSDSCGAVIIAATEGEKLNVSKIS